MKLVNITYFLIEHSSFKAATQDDLWRYLTEQAHADKTLPSDVTIKTIMDTWTLQMGFPVVSVTRDYKSKEATLVQVLSCNLLSSNISSDFISHRYSIKYFYLSKLR